MHHFIRCTDTCQFHLSYFKSVQRLNKQMDENLEHGCLWASLKTHPKNYEIPTEVILS